MLVLLIFLKGPSSNELELSFNISTNVWFISPAKALTITAQYVTRFCISSV